MAFLAMAVRSHLTSAILDPNQDAMIRMVCLRMLMAHPWEQTADI